MMSYGQPYATAVNTAVVRCSIDRVVDTARPGGALHRRARRRTGEASAREALCGGRHSHGPRAPHARDSTPQYELTPRRAQIAVTAMTAASVKRPSEPTGSIWLRSSHESSHKRGCKTGWAVEGRAHHRGLCGHRASVCWSPQQERMDRCGSEPSRHINRIVATTCDGC